MKPNDRYGKKVVSAKMLIHSDGTIEFKVRGYDFRCSDMPIAVNGCLFAPVRSNDKPSLN